VLRFSCRHFSALVIDLLKENLIFKNKSKTIKATNFTNCTSQISTIHDIVNVVRLYRNKAETKKGMHEVIALWVPK